MTNLEMCSSTLIEQAKKDGTEIRTVTTDGLLAELAKINGDKSTICNILASVDVNLLKAKTNVFGREGRQVSKYKHYLLHINFNYSTSVKNLEAKGEIELPENWQAKQTYCEKIEDGYNACLTQHSKTGQIYLTGKLLEATSKTSALYLVDEVEATDSEIVDIKNLLPKYVPNPLGISHKNFKIQNIKQIKLHGVLYVVKN
jgi:hypothetical protein